MSKIKGIYAAGLSILNLDLSLNIEKTISHSEKIIDQGCHGVAIFGSTGQAQLISVTEKITFLNKLSTSKYKEKYIIGTGLNSLGETINLMKVAMSLNFKKLSNISKKKVKRSHRDLFKKHIFGPPPGAGWLKTNEILPSWPRGAEPGPKRPLSRKT